MVDYYFDKGSKILKQKLIADISASNYTQIDKENLVHGILASIKQCNKVSDLNLLYKS